MDLPPHMSCSPPPSSEQPNPTPPPAPPSYDPVGIFWDYENCAPATNASGYSIVDNIRTLADQFGAVNLFKAYLQLPGGPSLKQLTLRSELQSCGLSLTDCPHTGKNSVDLMMIVDIMAFIKDNPSPATIILISGDRDFAYLLSTIRWRKYNVVLICNSFMTHESLTAQASVLYDWQSDILKRSPGSKPPLPRPRRVTVSSATAHAASQEFDIHPESDVRDVGLANGHLTPATQPLVLPSYPLGMVPDGPTNPRHVPLPPNTLLAEPETTPMPPKVETSAEAVSSSIPSGRIVADLASEPTTGRSSPETTDPGDDDGAYSLAFSSPEMIPSKGKSDILSPPGRLLLIDEESPAEPRPKKVKVADPPIPHACECALCAKSPVSHASQISIQGIAGAHHVEHTLREPSLSTDAGPLQELSTKPPLNILAPAFTPRAPQVPESPTGVNTKRGFEDLIIVLCELSANGDPRPRFSTVFPLLMAKKPDALETAGVTRFDVYLQLAESAGIVTFTVDQHRDGDGWVALRHQFGTSSGGPSQQALSQHTVSRFSDLINILNGLRFAGVSELRFSTVSPRLLRKNPSIYESAGVTNFEEYVEAAVEAGVITVRGAESGDGWLKLSQAYYGPRVQPSTSTNVASPPLTRAASTDSPFAPLVDFLKSKQSTSAEPIPFCDVFAHFVWTLGHPDLVSLYTSVPGVTTFGQYIDAAINNGLVSLVGGTTASRDALLSIRDVTPALGAGVQFPEILSPMTQPGSFATPLTSPPPPQQVAALPPSVEVTPNSFQDLVAVLKELRASTGESESRITKVVAALLKRKPDAYASVGALGFSGYAMLAMEHGVVRTRLLKHGDGWVSLCDPGPAGLESASTSAGTPLVSTASPQPTERSEDGTAAGKRPARRIKGGGVEPQFVDLVETLRRMWKVNGDKQPLFTVVAPQIVRGTRKERTLGACGVRSFGAYVELAKAAGIVEIYYKQGGKGESMSLDPAIAAKAGCT